MTRLLVSSGGPDANDSALMIAVAYIVCCKPGPLLGACLVSILTTAPCSVLLIPIVQMRRLRLRGVIQA